MGRVVGVWSVFVTEEGKDDDDQHKKNEEVPHLGKGGNEGGDHPVEPSPRLHQPQHPQHAEHAENPQEREIDA